MKILTMITTCAAALALSGCALTTAGVKKGDERNFVRSFDDINAGRAIKARMKRAHGFHLKGIDVEVSQGIVLLSGNAARQDDKIEAERIAWSAPNIVQVGNEVQLQGRQGLIGNTRDGLLKNNIVRRLVTNKSTKARNYNIETHNGVVYLLGVARSQDELNEVARIASTTKGTREVVSYITIAGEPVGTGYASGQSSNLSGNQSGTYSSAPYQGSTTQYADGAYTGSTTGAIPYSPPANSALDPVTAYPSSPIDQSPLTGPVVRDSDAIDSGEPYYVDPQTGQRIEIPDGVTPIPYIPPSPGGLGAGGAPLPPGAVASSVLGSGLAQSGINMGQDLGKALPNDQQLGSFRVGQAGDAVSIIESAPYAIDPETGAQIPIVYNNKGESFILK